MNTLLYVTAGAMLIFISYMIVKGKKDLQEKLDHFYMISKNKVEVITCSSGWISLQVGVLLLVVFLTIYVSQHPEQSGSEDATGFLLVCIGLLVVLVLNMTLHGHRNDHNRLSARNSHRDAGMVRLPPTQTGEKREAITFGG